MKIQRLTVIDELVKHPNRELKEFIQERLNKRAVLDAKQQEEIVVRTHVKGHFGADKMYKAIWNEGYYWPGLRRQCFAAVADCKACLEYNVGREGFMPMKSMRAESPWDHVAVDCAVNFPVSTRGHRHILIMVDVSTKFVVTVPLKTLTMEEMATVFYQILCLFGPPHIMQSDNGVEFINKLVTALMKAAGVDFRQVAGYNPRANGLAERTVGNVKLVLKKKLSGMFDRWDDALCGVTFAINTTQSSSTQSTPFSLFFGRRANTWEDYRLAELSAQVTVPSAADVQEAQKVHKDIILPTVHGVSDKKQDVRNALFDKKRKLMPALQVGQKVMIVDVLRTSKLEPKFVGPYTVHRCNRRGTYSVKDVSGRVLNRTIPISQIKLCEGKGTLTGGDGSKLAEGKEQRYYVSKILDDRVRDGVSELLVRWHGYDANADTWEPAESFDDASTAANYWRLKSVRNAKRKRAAEAQDAKNQQKKKKRKKKGAT